MTKPEDYTMISIASLETEEDLVRVECELEMQRILTEAWKRHKLMDQRDEERAS